MKPYEELEAKIYGTIIFALLMGIIFGILITKI